MIFYRPYRIHDASTREQLFRGMGLNAQQVYDDYLRALGRRVSVGDKRLASMNGRERETAIAAVKFGHEDWIDDDSIFMVAEDGKR